MGVIAKLPYIVQRITLDFVALETIRCLQKIDTKNEYFIFTGEGGDRCLEELSLIHI